eukprot:gene18886-24681_t
MSIRTKLPIDKVLLNAKYPTTWPFKPDDFKRQDESIDSNFYSQPRFVYHIDDDAVKSLTNYYDQVIKPNSDILDICSSWVSHLPTNKPYGKVVGLGMNDLELKANKQLTSYNLQDLNVNAKFPYEANTFDIVTCVVSVDYLIKPLEVFKEINRVLKPQGKVIISQSNRCFPTKAINIWLNTNDLEHAFIIGSYIHYAGGFSQAIGLDITADKPFADPMFIIQAEKL